MFYELFVKSVFLKVCPLKIKLIFEIFLLNFLIFQIVHSSHLCGAGGIGSERGFAPGIQKQPNLGHGQTRQSPQTGGGAQVEDRQAAGGH